MHILPLFFYIVQVDGWRSEIDQRPFTLKVDRTSNLPQPQVLSNHSHNSHDAIRSAPYPVDLGRPFGKGRSDPLYDTTNSQASTSLFPNSAVLWLHDHSGIKTYVINSVLAGMLTGDRRSGRAGTVLASSYGFPLF